MFGNRRPRRMVLFVVTFVLFFASVALGADVETRPLSDVFLDLQECTRDQAVEMARTQTRGAVGEVPLYQSFYAGDEKVFEGYFIPRSNSTKLAVFSDDGVSVFLDGSQTALDGVDNYDQKQYLPNITQSFHELPVSWVAGEVHDIRITYKNVIYTGEGDIDGVTLFAYGGGGDLFAVLLDPTAIAARQGETPRLRWQSSRRAGRSSIRSRATHTAARLMRTRAW